MSEIHFIDPNSNLGKILFRDSEFGAALSSAFGEGRPKCGCIRCHLRRRLENEGHTLTLDDTKVINAVIASYPGLADTINQIVRSDILKGQSMVNMVAASGYPVLAKAISILLTSYIKIQEIADELKAESVAKSAETGEVQPMAEKPPEDPLPQQAPIA